MEGRALRYRCLVLDHDDTPVMGTPLIHYPAHVMAMKDLRSAHAPIDLDGSSGGAAFLSSSPIPRSVSFSVTIARPAPRMEGASGLAKRDVVVVNDLRSGLEMAEVAGVDFVAAGWGHSIPEIKQIFQQRQHGGKIPSALSFPANAQPFRDKARFRRV